MGEGEIITKNGQTQAENNKIKSNLLNLGQHKSGALHLCEFKLLFWLISQKLLL